MNTLEVEISLFSINMYASPDGTAMMTSEVTSHCVKSPAKGVLKGLLLAKNEENGMMPSLPNS